MWHRKALASSAKVDEVHPRTAATPRELRVAENSAPAPRSANTRAVASVESRRRPYQNVCEHGHSAVHCGRTFRSGRPLILLLPSTTFHAGQSAWDCGHKYPAQPGSRLLLAVAPQPPDVLSATPRLSVLHGSILLIPNAREKTFPSTSLPTVHLPAEHTVIVTRCSQSRAVSSTPSASTPCGDLSAGRIQSLSWPFSTISTRLRRPRAQASTPHMTTPLESPPPPPAAGACDGTPAATAHPTRTHSPRAGPSVASPAHPCSPPRALRLRPETDALLALATLLKHLTALEFARSPYLGATTAFLHAVQAEPDAGEAIRAGKRGDVTAASDLDACPSHLYSKTGTDDVVDLFNLLDIGSSPTDRLSELGFLLGGVGLNGTPSRLRSSVPTTTKEQAGPFALLDIHNATVGRDLCLVMPLAQLNAASDLTEPIGIQATLV
ncbi:uncharacterized protein BXZ73DRAFT_76559 [Epithele typhae]|uniref:uncharacterized protein n=1 Tax=Epithele typhae TaxID=378194 RepID=UPI0020077EDE|nr:uncharacterized protein BXZ73DRAFT_76559 [Epithele typhae]KAH9936729.1 hypothetical protein BXZ73DRAFT_76559 [Epithele typhae]